MHRRFRCSSKQITACDTDSSSKQTTAYDTAKPGRRTQPGFDYIGFIGTIPVSSWESLRRHRPPTGRSANDAPDLLLQILIKPRDVDTVCKTVVDEQGYGQLLSPD